MIAAFNKVHFPKLQRIRALGQSMLNALNKSDGPSGEDGGYVRYNRWSKACLRFGIRLDDCTGESLGTLPQDNDSEDESEDESGDGRSDDDYDDNADDGGEWASESNEEVNEWARGFPLPEGSGRIMELTHLLGMSDDERRS